MRTFPIFVRFDRKPPLVVGGGELAAVKTRLLLKRAASVDVAARSVVPELSELVAKGQVALIAPEPAVDAVRGRPVVISATGDDEEDARVSAMARALGVPVNVPDRPELCTFALPAIVDRGEITVAIGTDGASPVLAQRLRAWLERELHPRVGLLARIAGDFRERVAQHLRPGRARRDFWEGVFDGPAAKMALSGDEAKARRLIGEALAEQSRAGQPAGRVILVGAGPGDPDLMTLKAVRALKSADVILYDRLIGDGVLEHARREAELIPVGKAKGCASVPQSEINRLLIERARAGQLVVRLKGGDPFVFGRGGEEIEALRAAGVTIDVVPGVTAAVAAAASLQIPLTHRDLSHSLTLISGHAAGEGEPRFDHVDFAALANGQNTVAVYMGVSTAAAVAQTMMDAGWRPATPVIVVERASRPDERRVSTALDQLAFHLETLQLAGPAIILIGEVAGLAAAGEVESADFLVEQLRAYA